MTRSVSPGSQERCSSLSVLEVETLDLRKERHTDPRRATLGTFIRNKQIALLYYFVRAAIKP